MSRLEQLANIFSIELSELLGLGEVHIFNPVGDNNSISQNLCNYSNDQLQTLTEKFKPSLFGSAKEAVIYCNG